MQLNSSLVMSGGMLGGKCFLDFSMLLAVFWENLSTLKTHLSTGHLQWEFVFYYHRPL